MEDNIEWLWEGAKEGELYGGSYGGGGGVAVPFAGHIGDDGWTSRRASSFRDCPRFILR